MFDFRALRQFIFAIFFIAIGASILAIWSYQRKMAPCDTQLWDRYGQFDSIAWNENKNRREVFYDVLQRDLVGMRRRDVEALLGAPMYYDDSNGQKSMRFFLAKVSPLTCSGRVAALMKVQIDSMDVVTVVDVYWD